MYEQKSTSAMEGSDAKKRNHAMAIDLYRSTANSTLRFFVSKSEKLNQPFLASLGFVHLVFSAGSFRLCATSTHLFTPSKYSEKCLAVCYGRSLRLNYPHLRHLHHQITDGGRSSSSRHQPSSPHHDPADANKRFMSEVTDMFAFMEALAKAERPVVDMKPMPEHPLSVDVMDFVKYVRVELEKVST